MLPTPQEQLSAKSAPREGIPTFKETLNATSATGVLLRRMARWNAVPAPQAMAQTLTTPLASNAQQGSTAMMAMVAGIAGAAMSQKRDLQRWAVTHVQRENTSRIVTQVTQVDQVDMELDRDLCMDPHTHLPMDPHTDVFYTEPVDRLVPRWNVLIAREAGTATRSSDCYPCWSGTAAPNGSATCVECSPGTYAGYEASECSNCSAGTFSYPGSDSCVGCGWGSVSSEGDASCTACPMGQYANDNLTQCLECDAGRLLGLLFYMALQCHA